MTRPSLSLCLTTRSDAAQVHALLDLMRPHVDEIVLAVDRKGDRDTLDACAGLADRRLLFELERNPNWLASWVQQQCSGDWILRLDDDEAPSAALLEALPELIAERYPTAWRIPRRWLAAADRYIVGFPWEAETLARLVRNQPGLWHIDGAVHREGHFEGESRFAEPPIYHLDTVLTPIERRREKSEWYGREGAGFVCEGVDVNRFYLPEEWPGLETRPVPDADRPAIARLLDPRRPPAPAEARAPVERVETGEIARCNRLPVQFRDCAGRVEIRSRRPSCPPAVRRLFQVVVENTGTAPWWRMLPPQAPPVTVGWRWLDGAGTQIGSPGISGLASTVFPGERILAWIAPETPPDLGEHVLEVQLAFGDVERFGAIARATVAIEPPTDTLLPDTVDRASAYELSLIERERALDRRERALGAFFATRRYRFANAIARPLDRLRGLARPRE